jgi:hypothetical protein
MSFPNRSETPTTNRAEAERFIEALTSEDPSTAVLDFAVFADCKKRSPEPPAFRVRGRLPDLWENLLEANHQGSGVFITVNESDGKTFLGASIVALRAAFVDDDKADPPVTFNDLIALAPGVPPSITVQSKHGQHNYWCLQPGETVSDFPLIQTALAKKLDTDPIICDFGRVMRLPGTLHVKDPLNPFLVKVLQTTDVAYTVREIADAFDILPRRKEKAPKPKKGPKKPVSVLAEEERVRRARAYITAMGPALEGKGGDQHTFKVASVLVRDFDLDDERGMVLLREWNAGCKPPWSDEDLETKLTNARAYGKGEVGSKVEDNSGIRDAIIRAGSAAAGALDEFRPSPPAWTVKQFSADAGPLVHFVPSGKAPPEPEWIQSQPSGQMIADVAESLVRYCNTAVFSHPGFGLRYYKISERNLATPTTRELLMPDVREICRAMMGGFSPTPETFSAAEQHIRALPRPGSDLPPLRWEGEKHMALHELPLPKEGDWSAWQEFTSRCSCPDTFMAFIWSCVLPEEHTGREAIILVGKGLEGKSAVCEVLMRFLGPVATASEILKGENRFELANLLNKRLVYFGDFRNPRPIHSKIMREIISGAYLYMEGKGKDGQSAYFHPRCLLSTNVEPRISISDRAEYSRIRRINIEAPAASQSGIGDREWPRRLLAQMPAFLFECRKVYDRMVPSGKDIPITPACHEALRGGEGAMAEEFDFLAVRLEVTGDMNDYISARNLVSLMSEAKYTEWVRTNAYNWLRSQGATNKTPEGKDLVVKKGGKAVRIWRGIKLVDGGVFEGMA